MAANINKNTPILAYITYKSAESESAAESAAEPAGYLPLYTTMATPLTPSTPPHPHTAHLTRDERLQVQTLHLAKHSVRDICELLKLTRRQVTYAITSNQVTPRRRSGRPRRLTDAQVDELIAYIRSSRASRRMTFEGLATGPFEAWGVGQYTIRNALRQRGYVRRVARAKPPLSEQNRQNRLKWAEEHKDWSLTQWRNILWSDES